jgi:hypothetical protein
MLSLMTPGSPCIRTAQSASIDIFSPAGGYSLVGLRVGIPFPMLEASPRSPQYTGRGIWLGKAAELELVGSSRSPEIQSSDPQYIAGK